eukprot:m.45377 g.45377  ORF g.45377 m.45377 type:complete len:74 (+) comp33585_c0_seq15:1949-2170(+)
MTVFHLRVAHVAVGMLLLYLYLFLLDLLPWISVDKVLDLVGDLNSEVRRQLLTETGVEMLGVNLRSSPLWIVS